MQKLIATLQKDPAEHVRVEVTRDSEHDVLDIRFWTKRNDSNTHGPRERGIGLKLLPILTHALAHPEGALEAWSVATWHEELLELAVRHNEIGIEPDLAVMNDDELYGALMFLRRVEANQR